ncbi:hypothetical protein GDO81_006220 [Engystomops pustulosus]|uniref:Uncharacterized protein n=1 Tax=Engystomops pustulosus TaxID=76066 RepID=A0AAV7CYB1_ENGPU|nr:hypothetical protein GDO81_006220 [Engystomops pustulosus]
MNTNIKKRFSFSFSYSPHEKVIKAPIFKNWKVLREESQLGEIVMEKPLISFRHSTTQRIHLVKSRFTTPRKNWLKDCVPELAASGSSRV